MTIKNSYTLTELTKGLDVVIKGDANCLISGVCPIQQSQSGRITFLTNSLYRKFLSNTQAAAVILSPGDAEFCSVNAVITSNAHFVYSQIAAFFAEKKTIQAGVHPTVIVGEGCEIDPTASVGAYCVLGRNVKLAAGVVIGANTCIGDESSIGENSYLDTRVTIYDHVRIGKRAHIYSGVVIGADGFGFAHQKNIWYKVPQLGSVSIGDDVDIGANTTIDRGAIEDTIIEDGVKLDNLIQIGHNVKIGAHTIIAGCVGIAGSAVIGKNCMIGGASLIAGHVSIHDNVIITGNTGVSKSLREPGIYSSGIVGVVSNEEFRKNNARFHRLENLMQRVKTLEGTLKEIKVRDNT